MDRIQSWLPKADWPAELTERHPAFAEGLARVGDVISTDGHVPARYKLLFATAIAALSPSERQGLDIGALTSLGGPEPIGELTWKGSEKPIYGDRDENAWLF